MPISAIVSYVDLTDANLYFSQYRFDSTAWDGASDADKTKALANATRDIEQLRFKGAKTNPKQILEFPRNGDKVIPEDILKACCEQAYAYLDGQDHEFEFDQLSRLSDGFSSVRTSYDPTKVREHKQAGILSIVAWRYLKPYLTDPQDITFKRV